MMDLMYTCMIVTEINLKILFISGTLRPMRYYGSGRFTYQHDARGNQIEAITYQWDQEFKVWVKKERSVQTYNAGGIQTELIKSEWNTETSRLGKQRASDF